MNPQSMMLDLIYRNSEVKTSQGPSGHAINTPQSEGGIFSGLLEQVLRPGKTPCLRGDKKTTNAKGTAPEWVKHFRHQLLLLGIPLDEMSLSREALPDLKKILIGEGYAESAVMDFLNGIFQGKGGHEIGLIQLFEGLSELKAVSDKKSEDAVLEVSVVPYLEAILRRLGLDLQEVNSAIDHAKAGEGRLNLKSLVCNVKHALKDLPEVNQFIANGRAAEDIKDMLTRAGIIDDASRIDGPISLERFVRILEQRVTSLMPRSLSDTQIENHVNALLENVLVPSKEKGGKSGIESLYAHKLKAFPDNDSKANPAFKQIAEGWENSASHIKKAGMGAEATVEFKEKQDELFSKMEKLIETVQASPGKKAVAQDKGTLSHSVGEAMTNRGPAPDAVVKQVARPIPLHVVNQVARQISVSLQRGENHLRLQLRPPRFGAIQIDMDMKDSVLKIGLTTENNSVKEFLISSSQELRDSLVQHGVKLEKLDVQVNYNLGESMTQAGRGQNEFERQREKQRGGPDAVTGDGDDSETTIPRIIRADALLDLVA